MTVQLPPPGVLLGIPNYDKWRTNQDVAFQAIMDWYSSDKRYIGMSMPTGSGKTICALLAAKMTDVRTVILTATKGLQEQYLFTGQQLGMVSVSRRASPPQWGQVVFTNEEIAERGYSPVSVGS